MSERLDAINDALQLVSVEGWMPLDDAGGVDLGVFFEEVEQVLRRVALFGLRCEDGVMPVSEADHVAFLSFEPEMDVFIPDVGLEEPPLELHLSQP